MKKEILLLTFASIIYGAAADNKEHTRSYVPLEKGRSEEYITSLFDKGEQKIYSGDEIKYIAMPCSGIGSGEVNVQGDGRLCFYDDVYNDMREANGKAKNGVSTGYQYIHPEVDISRVKNNFAIAIESGDSSKEIYYLNGDSFDDIHFIGEYPLAQLTFQDSKKSLPVEISTEVYSPYVPNSVRESANPITIMRVTVKNSSKQRVKATLAGWMMGAKFRENDGVKYTNVANSTKQMASVAFQTLPTQVKREYFEEEIDSDSRIGEMSIAILSSKAKSSVESADIETLIEGAGSTQIATEQSDTAIGGGVYESISLSPGEQRVVTFAISWYYPHKYDYAVQNLRKTTYLAEYPGYVGHIYNNWYDSSTDVLEYIADQNDELYTKTKLFHDTYFDTTIPYWLTNRMTMALSTLACGNVSIWENGRFYSYEGIGFCPGTCGHVYNFVPTVAQLFPSLERSVRLMQDFNPEAGFKESGRINFRGHGADREAEVNHRWASDAQSGYVLKAYREHLMSENNSFLDSIWERVKMAIGYQIFKDGAEIGLRPNGILECEQTFWDPMWYGPNPYNATLYLAALRAAEEMAKVQGELALAERYHSLYMQGREYMSTAMWNGEYYVHLYPMGMIGHQGMYNGSKTPIELDKQAESYIKSFNACDPTYFVSTACDANQLFGQNWAFQLGLGNILPEQQCATAIGSVYKYNFTPDISTVYDFKKSASRTLAAPGEAAMINGSWPKDAPTAMENTHDKSDIWSGLEYDAACNMISCGDIREAFVVLKAIDDRYDGTKRNPWNEIEGSNHYSRAMQSWNVLRNLSGYTYNGPEGKISFSPKLTPEEYQAFFTVAKGWGNYAQEISDEKVSYTLKLAYGSLRLTEISLPLLTQNDNYSVSLNGKTISAKCSAKGDTLLVALNELNLKADDLLQISVVE
ncbi:MAG: GH116 family glycosyl hydrolase [Rikenellaceae bacterium]